MQKTVSTRTASFCTRQKLTIRQRMMILSRLDRMGKNQPTPLRLGIALLLILALMFTVSAVQNYTWAQSTPQGVEVGDNEIQISFVGDVCLGRYVETYAQKNGYEALFDDSQELWNQSDLVFGNLECTLLPEDVSSYTEADKNIHIHGLDSAASVLKEVGFTHLSCANNHMADFGREGVTDTLNAVQSAGIVTAGAGSNALDAIDYHITEVNGMKIGFMAFSDVIPVGFSANMTDAGIATSHFTRLYQNVSDAAMNCDLVIVYAHWGSENAIVENSTQEELAHRLIDSGADVVIGSHSHTLQPIEEYKSGIIFYSLGNYVFDQGSRDSRNTCMVQMNLNTQNKSAEFTVIPMRINNFHPYATNSSFYQRQIQASLLRNLTKNDYEISEDGRIHLSLNFN